MRFWIAGPRIGFFRPGISFGAPRYSPRYGNAAAPAGEFVYVIENERGHAKIGISTDPNARIATLQTGSSGRLAVVFSIFAGDRGFDIEQEAHAILDRYRLSGEWFNVSQEAAIASIYAAAARLGAPLGDDAYQPQGRSTFSILIIIGLLTVVVMAMQPNASSPVIWTSICIIAAAALLKWLRWWPFNPRRNLTTN